MLIQMGLSAFKLGNHGLPVGVEIHLVFLQVVHGGQTFHPMGDGIVFLFGIVDQIAELADLLLELLMELDRPLGADVLLEHILMELLGVRAMLVPAEAVVTHGHAHVQQKIDGLLHLHAVVEVGILKILVVEHLVNGAQISVCHKISSFFGVAGAAYTPIIILIVYTRIRANAITLYRLG